MTVNRSDFQRQLMSEVTADDKLIVLDDDGTDEPGVVTGSTLASSAVFNNTYIPRSVLTTTGDILTQSGGAAARVARTVLVQDSAFQNAFALFPFSTGYYYSAPSVAVDSTSAQAQSTMLLTAFPVSRPITLDRIGVEVTTGAASNVIRLGMYSSTNGVPSTLLFDAGTIDASTQGAKEITISQSLATGYYFLACVLQGGTGAGLRVRAQIVTNVDISIRNANVLGWVSNNTVTGALPSTVPGLSTAQTAMPKVMVRVA